MKTERERRALVTAIALLGAILGLTAIVIHAGIL